MKAKRRARKQQLSVGLTLVILGILTASPKAISAICEHKTKNYAFIWARSHQPWNGAVSVQAMLLSRGQLVLCLAVTLCYTSGEAAPIVAEELAMPARHSVQQHQIVPESLANIPPEDVANSSASDWLRAHPSDPDSDDSRVLVHVLSTFLQIDDGSSNETGSSSETESTEEDEEQWTCGDKDTACSDQLGAYLLIIVTLIAATIVFESLREYMQERTAGLPSRLIVDAIFSELTVLGFLGLLTFLVKKAGTAHLSRAIYGDTPYSENSKRFSEDLEDVHMIIFIVMLFFVFQALGILLIMAYFRRVQLTVPLCAL